MAKKSIALITDSTCNIPPELVEKYSIYVVLQHLIWGTEDLLDLKDITPSDFYERLMRDPIHPKTSQPPASEFAQMINQAKADGAEEVVILTVSGPLSGTRASAEQAKELVDIPIYVHDSRSVGMGLGWQVIAAARAREADGDAQAMLQAAEKARTHTAMILAVDTLDFLHKGGRIGGAAKLIGSMINLKPQLIVNRDTGLVESGERTRTRKKSIQSMWDAYFGAMDTSKPMYIGVHHAAAPQEAKELMERIRNEHSPKELWLTELTPVLGTHGGPGTLAMTGYYDPD